MTRQRRPRGSGSIAQRKDGTWQASVSLGSRQGKQVRRYFYARTREGAEAKMLAEFPDLLDPTSGGPTRPRTAVMIEARMRGTHTQREWFALIQTHEHACYYCGHKNPPGGLTKDHRIPVTRGGSDGIDNIVPACKPCNSEKSDLTDVEFLDMFAGRQRPRRVVRLPWWML